MNRWKEYFKELMEAAEPCERNKRRELTELDEGEIGEPITKLKIGQSYWKRRNDKVDGVYSKETFVVSTK